MSRPVAPTLLLTVLALTAANPAFAQSAEKDEKLPAQLPSVTIQGEDLSGAAAQGGKVAPTAGAEGPRVRLPEPPQRRATRDGNRALMVNVTPSTLETPQPPAGPILPYTSLTGGWGPVTQYRFGLYDSREWGPALGITELAGRSGWGWSDWRGKEWLDWKDVGRLSLQGDGFAWTNPEKAMGSQTLFGLSAEHGEGANMIAGVDLRQGALGNAAFSRLAAARIQARPAPMGDHQLTLKGQGQYRTWGLQAGLEGYLEGADFWSLSDAVQLEAGLGGGYWGFEPILDPRAVFHYRPASTTHLYVGLRTATELPDFEALYLRHPSTVANPALTAERVEGWAEVGGSHRFSDQWWGSVVGELKRSHRHIYWSDSDADGLWMPVNAAAEQYAPGLSARLQHPWTPKFSQALKAGWSGVFPLNSSELTVGTSLEGTFLDDKLGVVVGLDARSVKLSTQQSPTGGAGLGVFAEASFSYALGRDWALSLTVEDLPITLSQPAPNYFTPVPLLSGNVQYQF